MTSREFAFSALRIIAVALLIRLLPHLASFGDVLLSILDSDSVVKSDLGKASGLYVVVMAFLIILFWFKAQLLSAYFVLNKPSTKVKTEMNDWYNLVMVGVGIAVVITSIDSLYVHIAKIIFSSSYYSGEDLDYMKTEETIYITSAVLQLVLGLFLIMGRDKVLRLLNGPSKKPE